ncbi:MAG TPA: hypothetical protein VNJ07_12440 [Chitinophagales bacterium]|nr:hypothetical protein [Chitinophagales bacterium]
MKYVIADDVSTTGSTLNDLCNYIEQNGGEVIAALALAVAHHRILGQGTQLTITPQTLSALRKKFGAELTNFVREHFGYEEISQLSNGQGKYLLTFGSLDSIRRKIAQSLGGTNGSEDRQISAREEAHLRQWALRAGARINRYLSPKKLPSLSLGAAEILAANGASLDYNGYTPAYTQLESYDHLIDKADNDTQRGKNLPHP